MDIKTLEGKILGELRLGSSALVRMSLSIQHCCKYLGCYPAFHDDVLCDYMKGMDSINYHWQYWQHMWYRIRSNFRMALNFRK